MYGPSTRTSSDKNNKHCKNTGQTNEEVVDNVREITEDKKYRKNEKEQDVLYKRFKK